jgi:hypothetical protein
MAIEDKIFYNEASAAKLGWDPNWFGEDDFDGDLIDKIKEFQNKHDLTADGLCGPMTHRRLVTEREAGAALAKHQLSKLVENDDDGSNYIICESRRVKIDWHKVINVLHEDALVLPPDCYRNERRGVEKPSMIVTHFDVCLSAHSCYRVLKKRGISSHFVIDNDGSIYQMLDTIHEGWHGGNRRVNRASVGVDISNAFYVKYQKYYRAKGHGTRPVLTDVPVHGARIKECLGFYPVQIEAYKALVKALCDHYDIPVECPLDDDGKLLRKVHPPSVKAQFKGVVNHFHLTRGKIDTANLEMDKVLEEIRNETD